jgi:hypothetical protein
VIALQRRLALQRRKKGMNTTELTHSRKQVAFYTDCTEPGKPVYHDLWRLASTYPGFTGYLNSTPIESWPEAKRLRRWASLKAAARRKLTEFEGRPVTTKKPAKATRPVTTKQAYKRFQPHPKKYSSNAARQKAYRARLKRRKGGKS